MSFSIVKKGYNTKEVDVFIEAKTKEYEAALEKQKERIFSLKQELTECENSLTAHREKSDLVQKAIYNAVAKAEEIEKLAQAKYEQEIKQLKVFHEKWITYYNRIIEAYPLDDELLAASKFNNQMKNILSKASVQNDKPAESALLTKTLENNYESESQRIQSSSGAQKRIGYITVSVDNKTANTDSVDLGLSPEIFDPTKKIADYFLNKELEEKPKKSPAAKEKAPAKKTVKKTKAASKSAAKAPPVKTASVKSDPVKKPAPKPAPAENEYDDRSESGFSFQEALNPKQDLSDIMKDLGLLEE